MRDTTQESLDNMPENLQYSPTAELLQERVDALQGAIDEFDGLDLDYEEKDEDELKELVADDLGIDSNDEDFDSEITEDQIEEKRQELESEWVQEKLEEIQGISIE